MNDMSFIDREREIARLRPGKGGASGLSVVYGRRRIGKTRLIREAFRDTPAAVFYTADERETPLQIRSFASAVSAVIPGFDQVEYPGFDPLLDRIARDHPRNVVIVIDEFPYLAARDRSLPSLLQKYLDEERFRDIHVVLCGSSQRMMQGLVLDSNAPLYGRANQILKIEALAPGYAGEALGLRAPAEIVEAWAVFGGIPRYWELARNFRSVRAAASALILDPLGPLNEEPRRLLVDDTRDVAQAASILALVGRGSNRLSEIAGRLGKPATSLTRPVSRLVDLGILRRETPFGAETLSSKKSLYKIDDPFLRFWFRLAEPNRSRLSAGDLREVSGEILEGLPQLVSEAWEDLCRMCIPRMRIAGRKFGEASRYWGPGSDRKPMEIDAVAASTDGRSILIGEATWSGRQDIAGKAESLLKKAARFPLATGKTVVPVLFCREKARAKPGIEIVNAAQVLGVLR